MRRWISIGVRPLDRNVATILGELDKLGLCDNTESPVESYYWSWHNEDAIRFRKIEDSERFTNVRVRAVPYEQAR